MISLLICRQSTCLLLVKQRTISHLLRLVSSHFLSSSFQLSLSPSSPSALFSFHLLRLPPSAVSPASPIHNLSIFIINIFLLRWHVCISLPSHVQPESTDCLLVPSANVGVPRWLPSRPFVIPFGLTGLWPDVGYKSNQMFGGEDAEECVIHSVPAKVPQLLHWLILKRIVLLDFSVSKIKKNKTQSITASEKAT